MNMLMQMTLWDRISNFDSGVYKLVSGFTSNSMTSFMKAVSFIGSAWILTLLVLFILAASFAYKSLLRCGILIAVNYAAVSLLNNIIKLLIHRPRPEILRLVEISGYSFPSWHAMTAMAFFGYIIYLIIKYLKNWTKYLFAAIFGLLIFTIGFSRIYLGVHFASDVLAGYIFGLVWAALFARLTNRFLARKG